jgi:GPH family glycoside/pentoside/hexuronide:cation symporter
MKPLKKWQEPIYALGSLGPSILNQIVLSWILFYYLPSEAEIERTGALVLIGAAAASAVWIVARLIDGVCDIPIASWTDNLRSRWGRRRPMMALGLIPMGIAFILIWYPPVQAQHWANVVWMAVWSSAFFFFYTFIVVPYLALLSEMVQDQTSRMRIASWQTVFGTIAMAGAMVAGPMLIENLGYKGTAWALVGPGLLCFLGPLLVIKEPPSDGTAPEHPAADPVPFWRSIQTTLNNRSFAIYMLSMATFYFALQFFLTGQPYMVTAVMDLDKGQASVLNAAAFGLIPFTLPLMNYFTRRRGAKYAYRLAVLAFGVIMLLFPLTWSRLKLPLSPMMVGVVLSGLVSYSAAVLMTAGNAFPAEIAHYDTLETGEHRAGMYFAVQGVINQTIAAIAGAIVVQLVTHLGSSVARPYGALILTPIGGVLCFLSWWFFRSYPLGQPKAEG